MRMGNINDSKPFEMTHFLIEDQNRGNMYNINWDILSSFSLRLNSVHLLNAIYWRRKIDSKDKLWNSRRTNPKSQQFYVKARMMESIIWRWLFHFNGFAAVASTDSKLNSNVASHPYLLWSPRMASIGIWAHSLFLPTKYSPKVSVKIKKLE